MNRYGTPYMGSKNKIAEWVVSNLPKATNLYDLFAGGCAITHCAMVQHRYQHFHANDISDSPQLFADAINGKFNNETGWISREDFFKLKDSEPYVRYLWSFGNSGDMYMYAKELEPWKKALHFARVLNDRTLLQEMGIDGDGSRKDVTDHKEEYKQKYIAWWLKQQKLPKEELDRLIAMTQEQYDNQAEELRQLLCDALAKSGLTQAQVGERLGTQMQGHYFGKSQWAFPTKEYYEQMQTFMPLPTPYEELIGLRRLHESLESNLPSLTITQGDYQAVPILPDSVIYLDPPYKGTAGYNGTTFDHERLYEWCRKQTTLTVISEYNMPEDFVEVAQIEKRSLLDGSNNAGKKIERLFVPKHQKEEYERRMKREQEKVKQIKQLSLW